VPETVHHTVHFCGCNGGFINISVGVYVACVSLVSDSGIAGGDMFSEAYGTNCQQNLSAKCFSMYVKLKHVF
jgi:hypothetical protein